MKIKTSRSQKNANVLTGIMKPDRPNNSKEKGRILKSNYSAKKMKDILANPETRKDLLSVHTKEKKQTHAKQILKNLAKDRPTHNITKRLEVSESAKPSINNIMSSRSKKRRLTKKSARTDNSHHITKSLNNAEKPVNDNQSSNNEKEAPASGKSKYIYPSSYVDCDKVAEAVEAVYKLADIKKASNKMFEEDSMIFLQINSMKIQNKKGNIHFQLAHPTLPPSGEVCLITPDLKKGRKPDHEPTIEHWEDLLRTADVTKVKTILPMRQLRVEYDQFELKRRLMTQHDFIMVDTRVLKHVSHLLGKMFFKKHNLLVPVRLFGSKDLKKSIDKALASAMLRLSEGPTSTLVVGNISMPQKQVVENILAVMKQLESKFPGGQANIRMLEVKTPNSLPILLYMTLRPKNTVLKPKLREDFPKMADVVEGELSTIPNSTVTVTSSGKVIVTQSDVKDELLDSDFEVEEETETVVDDTKEEQDE